MLCVVGSAMQRIRSQGLVSVVSLMRPSRQQNITDDPLSVSYMTACARFRKTLTNMQRGADAAG